MSNLFKCTDIVLYSVAFLGALAVVPMIHGAHKVACYAAYALELSGYEVVL